MLRVVLDTNVLVSAFIAEGNEYQVLKMARFGKIKLILSPEIFEEFNDVISREKFGFSKEQIIDMNKQVLITTSNVVYPTKKLDVVKDDPSDNKILEAAVTGKADYIITGDNHLLKLKKFKGVKIINAHDFLKLF